MRLLMDLIDKLPKDENYSETPDEISILNEYFAKAAASGVEDPKIKTSLYLTVLFFITANPVTDKLLDFIPHMGSPLIRTIAKMLVFFIISYIILAK